MYSLQDDLKTLTNISSDVIDKLVNKILYIICDDVLDTHLNNNTVTDIDTGIGVLSICVDNNQIKYRFIPSTLVESAIKNTIVDLKSPVKERASKTLASKINEIYEELL